MTSSHRFAFNFVCDERIPETVITYGQEILQSILLILEFCTDNQVSKLIAINAWYTDERAGTIQIRIIDRKLFMNQDELDSAFEIKSNEHPYGNERLYLVKSMLDIFQSQLMIESGLKTGTIFTF